MLERMKKLFPLLITLLIGSLVNGQSDLAAYLSVPFPSDLTAGPDGRSLAWVFNEQGSRNIFLAEGDQFKNVRRLTDFSGDNGLDLGSLTFTPDGRQLLFVRGNGTNSRGEAANPAQLQEATGQELFIMPLSGGKARRIAAGSAPAISPDGSMLLFLQKGQVWQASLTDTTQKPKQLFIARGSQGSLRWSPKGDKVAFISRRGDHAFVGIFDPATQSVIYPDASADLDSDPVWNPDGSSLAYIRRPNVRVAVPFTPRQDGHPWSIRLLDLEKELAREIWRADPGAGSVLVRDLPVAENKLWWAAGNQVIFPWEKSGWVQLYALDVQHETVLPLTWGDGIVENVTLSADGQTIYYSTNTGDSPRRHIWKVEVRARKPEQLTKGDQIEWSPVITASGLAMLHSSARRPAWPAIFQNAKVSELAPGLFPKDFPNTLVTPEYVSITAADGLVSHGQLFMPPGHKAGDRHPAVIFLHGGSRRQMLNGFHYSSYYSNSYAMNQFLAAQGYVVLALNYRSGIGYGLDFREADDYGVSGGSEVRDLIGAGEYLKARPDVDGNRIGLWGGSYGGYLTAHGLAQRSDLFAAGVDIHGVHNWNTELPNFASWYDSTHYAEIGKLAFQSSPMYHVDGWKNPVLFIHGDDDRNVPFGETVDLMEALRRRGVYFEQLIFPDEVHGFLLHGNWVKAYEATFGFMERFLKKQTRP